MNKPEFIILGGSAGSFQVIFGIIKKLPANFDVPILIVMHRGKDKNTHVEEVIAQQSKVKVQEVKDKERIINGTVYLAPPDYHVLIEPEKIFSLDNSEPVLFSRPSIDVSMQSAAEVYKKKLLAILFSGANSDGAVGMEIIKNRGGQIFVQHPKEAEVDTMPLAAIQQNAEIKKMYTQEIESLLINIPIK
jgi:two-component system chemotaxis response regulator CheB